jgi:YesN/AraC family two-component response regulator
MRSNGMRQYQSDPASLNSGIQNLPPVWLIKGKPLLSVHFSQRVIDPIMQLIQEKTDQEYKKISDEMILLINQETDSEITLESLGTKLNYSPAYLSQVFRKEKGISFTVYLTTNRVNIAKKWLFETDLSVNQIAQNLNFTNSQNFIRSFKRDVGMTPGKYRKLNEEIPF